MVSQDMKQNLEDHLKNPEYKIIATVLYFSPDLYVPMSNIVGGHKAKFGDRYNTRAKIANELSDWEKWNIITFQEPT